jgi:hypothetical protein
MDGVQGAHAGGLELRGPIEKIVIKPNQMDTPKLSPRIREETGEPGALDRAT